MRRVGSHAEHVLQDVGEVHLIKALRSVLDHRDVLKQLIQDAQSCNKGNVKTSQSNASNKGDKHDKQGILQ